MTEELIGWAKYLLAERRTIWSTEELVCTSSISQEDWTIFNRTGISHLVSISGLHITMIAALLAQLTFALWRRSFFTSTQLPLILPAQKAAAIAGALSAFIYVLLAGSGVPAQRTLCIIYVTNKLLRMRSVNDGLGWIGPFEKRCAYELKTSFR